MTDYAPKTFPDAWVNPARTGLNTGSWERLSLRDTGERVFVRPALPSGLFGRTVLSAVLRAHVSGSWAAQTVTLTRVTSRWVEGRVTSANQPTVTTTGQVAVATGALSDGGTAEWDITAMMQLFADGTDYYGFRITTDAATRQRLYSHQSGQPAWELEITVSDAPDVPSNLRPDGGAVSTGTPVLAWDFVDLGGDSTEQAQSRVQVDTPAVGVEPDEVAPDYDSGWVANIEPTWDLAASTYKTRSASVTTSATSATITTAAATFVASLDVDAAISGAGIPAGATITAVASATSATISAAATATGTVTATITRSAFPTAGTFWRVNVQDGDGNEAGWSDWAEFSVSSKPSVVMDSPVGTFGDPTPTIIAHLSSGTVAAWSIVVTGSDRSDVRAESGRQTGPVEWTVPLRGKDGRRVIQEGAQGWARVRIWDTVDRAAAVGDPTYAEVWVALNLDTDALVTAPTNLAVTRIGDGDPRYEWHWSRTEAADAWLIEVDGNTAVRLEPEDVTLVGGNYTWTDPGVIGPLKSREVGVRAVKGVQKSTAVTSQVQSHVKGVWLIPVDGASDPVQLAGGDVSSWQSFDAYATYETVGGRQHDVFYGWKPRAGVFEGFVDARNDVWATLDTLEDYRVNHNRLFRLVWGSQSMLVRLRDIDWTSSEAILPNNLEHVVRFGFVEWGE